MYRTANRNLWVLVIFMLCAIVLGGFVSDILANFAETQNINWLSWLNYGLSFGVSKPFILDIGVINLTFGLVFKFTVTGVIFMIVSIFIYRKMKL